MTTIAITGNLVRTPEMKFTSSGTPFTSFTVAESTRVKDRESGQWIDGEPIYHRCTAWNSGKAKLAENLANLAKGRRVIVVGELKSRTYEQDGAKRTAWEIRVTEAGPSFLWETVATGMQSRYDSRPNADTPPEDPWASGAADGPGW